jgi:hypothetical protein
MEIDLSVQIADFEPLFRGVSVCPKEGVGGSSPSEAASI